MNEFWGPPTSERTAFVLPDGSSVDYAGLAADIAAFRDRLTLGNGLIGLRCSGHYRQYVAYLAALQAQCPVLLLSEDQGAHTGLTLSYLYDAAEDRLETFESVTAPAYHPDLAVLLSTSGSTGAAKWVRLSYANLDANARAIATYLELTPEDRAPMALPFQYSYGMSVVNSHLAAGGALVLTEGSVLEPDFWALFEQAGCTSLAGVPHSFELMDQGQIRTDHLKRLRYVTQAGGRLAPARVRAWAERGRQEGWSFFVMYGQTEAAPRISYLPPKRAFDAPASIGVSVPGGEIWVADETGNPLPDGTAGELVYRGPNVMMGYATSDADLVLPQGPDILKTGDIAKRENGLFEIVGRASRFVKIFGLRISLDEVEKHLAEQGTEAAVGARDETLHVLLANAAGTSDLSAEVAGDLAGWMKVPETAFQVTEIDALPRHANGKIDNPAVARLIDTLAAPHRSEEKPGLLSRFLKRRKDSVQEIFRHHFPNTDIRPDHSFSDLGGDSLSYLAAALDLEKLLGDLPEDWTTRSIAELEGIKRSSGFIGWMDTPTFLRALAITLIVGAHFDAYDYGGGGVFVLLFVAGMTFGALTLPVVLQTRSIWPVPILLIRILLLSWAAITVVWLVGGYGGPLSYLMITNWIDPFYPGAVWFIAIYLQILLILTFVMFPVLKTEGLCARLTDDPFVPLAVLTGLSVLLVLTRTEYTEKVLFMRLPHLMGWIFVCGVLAQAADSLQKKAITLALFLIGWGLMSGEIKVTLFLVPLVIFLPQVPIPRVLVAPARQIASASLMIYLTHFQFRDVLEKFAVAGAVGNMIFAIVGGVIAWICYQPFDDWVRRQLVRRTGYSST